MSVASDVGTPTCMNQRWRQMNYRAGLLAAGARGDHESAAQAPLEYSLAISWIAMKGGQRDFRASGVIFAQSCRVRHHQSSSKITQARRGRKIANFATHWHG
jgi:hypothetical protein